MGYVAGVISIVEAISIVDVDEYHIYFGIGSSEVIPNVPMIANIPSARNGGVLQYLVPHGTVLPAAATHILVVTGNISSVYINLV